MSDGRQCECVFYTFSPHRQKHCLLRKVQEFSMSYFETEDDYSNQTNEIGSYNVQASYDTTANLSQSPQPIAVAVSKSEAQLLATSVEPTAAEFRQFCVATPIQERTYMSQSLKQCSNENYVEATLLEGAVNLDETIPCACSLSAFFPHTQGYQCEQITQRAQLALGGFVAIVGGGMALSHYNSSSKKKSNQK